MSLIQKTPPASEPMDGDQVRAWHRLQADDPSDATVDGLIRAAREAVEVYLRKRLISQTVTLLRDGFGGPILLTVAPIQSIAEVRFLDAAGVQQVLPVEDYRLIRSTLPNALFQASGKVWPVPLDEPDSVEIDIVVGYGADADAMPAPIRQAMLLLIGHMIENRAAVVQDASTAVLPMGVSDFLDPYRLWI